MSVYQYWDLSFTSPNSNAAPGVAVGEIDDLLPYDSLTVFTQLQGATGGNLDVYLQTSYDRGGTWVDYGHWATLTAGLALATKVVSMNRQGQVLTPVAVGYALNPVLGAAGNNFLGGDFGDRLRVVVFVGAGTTLGARQVIKISARGAGG